MGKTDRPTVGSFKAIRCFILCSVNTDMQNSLMQKLLGTSINLLYFTFLYIYNNMNENSYSINDSYNRKTNAVSELLNIS